MKVLFRNRPEWAGSPPELRGEMTHWNHCSPMKKLGNGTFEVEFDVPVGIYDYKFRHSDEDWRLDPLNPRTRSVAGARNNTLVVGGTGEPVLHVPARPFAYLLETGQLVLRAALRRGAGQSLAVRWDEGDGPRISAMRRVGDEDEHLLFELKLPASGSRVDYLFVLDDGGLVGCDGGSGGAVPFCIRPGQLAEQVPAWWRDAVVYSVFVDRFRAGGCNGSWRDPSAYARDVRCGGDLAGITEALPYLVELGVTALHLTPIGASPSVHRYNSAGPREVAPELGGEAAFAQLLDASHAAGIRVIVDIAVTHVDRSFFAFEDVARRGEESSYWSWFHIHSYPFSQGPRPGYRHYQKGQWQEPILDTDNPAVQDYLVGTFEHWARAGADGFRIDAAADIPLDLCRRIRRAVRAVNADAVVFGEVVPSHIERWTADTFDAATDFALQEHRFDWLVQRSIDSETFSATMLQRRFRRGGPGWTTIAFAGTHDQARIATRTSSAELARIAQLMVLTGSAVPMIYYGDEVGLCGGDESRAFEDSWPDRQCMAWDEAPWDRDTLALVRDLLVLRRERVSLRRGNEYPLSSASPEVLGVRRFSPAECTDVWVHRGEDTIRFEIEVGALLLLRSVGDVELDFDGPRPVLALGPRSAAVLDRDVGRAGALELIEHNAALARRAWREGIVESPAYPTHLYVTVTEVCNLRCQHCITRAPAKTAEGRARQLRPWLIEALEDAFAAASYVGFTHGGESLMSRSFCDVLAAIQRSHHGRAPADVHLATNGMMLTSEITHDLIDLGVNSIMVSIDGASAAINDEIRRGADLGRILDNLRAAVALREQLGADLRLGISTVVGRRNLGDLVEIGRIARDVGIDWLKVEETYPASDFARIDLLGPRDESVRAAVDELRREFAGSRVVLVEHLSPPCGCSCGPDASPELLAFRAADNFANRANFSPCRAPWEIACIDPDGAVHAVDYAKPVLGNLAEQDMLTLWNAAPAQRLRTDALAACGCGPEN